MNVLVTGATGFVGGALANRLHKMGVDVCATGRDSDKGRALQKHGIQFVAADLADTKKIKSLCAHRDFVFHCGALSSPWGRYRDFYNTTRGTTFFILNVKIFVHMIISCYEFF